MSKSFLRGLVLLLCVVSLTLHFSVESAGVLDSVWSHAEQADGPDTHGEEDHFVPVLVRSEYQTNLKNITVPLAFAGGLSHSIIPQLPPPKSI